MTTALANQKGDIMSEKKYIGGVRSDMNDYGAYLTVRIDKDTLASLVEHAESVKGKSIYLNAYPNKTEKAEEWQDDYYMPMPRAKSQSAPEEHSEVEPF